MENSNETSKIVLDALTMLSIMSELHEPINFYRFNLPKGLCILVEDADNMDSLLCTLNRLEDTQIMQSPRIMKSNLPNYKLAVYALKKTDTPDIVSDFLTMPKFLSAVIVSGAIPDNMPDTYVIVFPAGLVTHDDAEMLNSEICTVKQFLRDNPDGMEEELEMFNTSAEYSDYTASPLYTQMTLAAKMYKFWYRSCHHENETQNRYVKLQQNIQQLLDKSEMYLDNVDLSDIFVKLFFDYSEKHTELHFIHTDDATDKACAYLRENGNIIFYDDLFFYTPEKLFKKICTPLSGTFQITYIKENLRTSGILSINTCQNNCYTRKKVLFTESGIDSRNRFLWLSKKYFVSWDRLSPEEGGKTNESNLLGENRPTQLLDVKQSTEFFHNH